MKLTKILLDHLWIQRKEGTDFLEDLLIHFDVINIGKDYGKKFGDSGE